MVLVAVVVIGIFLLAPVISYTFTGTNFGIGSHDVTAQVSPSYYFVGCGLVYNPTQTYNIAGYSHSNMIWSGGEWRCKSS